MGSPDKAGAHILREFLGPKKYTLTTAFNQWFTYSFYCLWLLYRLHTNSLRFMVSLGTRMIRYSYSSTILVRTRSVILSNSYRMAATVNMHGWLYNRWISKDQRWSQLSLSSARPWLSWSTINCNRRRQPSWVVESIRLASKSSLNTVIVARLNSSKYLVWMHTHARTHDAENFSKKGDVQTHLNTEKNQRKTSLNGTITNNIEWPWKSILLLETFIIRVPWEV